MELPYLVTTSLLSFTLWLAMSATADGLATSVTSDNTEIDFVVPRSEAIRGHGNIDISLFIYMYVNGSLES